MGGVRASFSLGLVWSHIFSSNKKHLKYFITFVLIRLSYELHAHHSHFRSQVKPFYPSATKVSMASSELRCRFSTGSLQFSALPHLFCENFFSSQVLWMPVVHKIFLSANGWAIDQHSKYIPILWTQKVCRVCSPNFLCSWFGFWLPSSSVCFWWMQDLYMRSNRKFNGRNGDKQEEAQAIEMEEMLMERPASLLLLKD